MTMALLTLTFQGDPDVLGALDADDRREAQREAFPRSPRRDAQTDQAYRACKIAPLRSGRLLFSVVQNRGEKDAHGRPALRATACVLDREGLAGPSRDPAAVLRALEQLPSAESVDTFVSRVRSLSAWENDAAFDALSQELTIDGPFHARVAASLTRPSAQLSWEGSDDVGALRPALSLLPLARLLRLELATGSDDSDTREAVLGNRGALEGAGEERGRLGAILGRWRPARSASVDFRQRPPIPTEDSGPVDLVQAIIASSPWPGFTARERFRLLMASLDSTGADGKRRDPFELSGELNALRTTVRQIEALTERLEGWR